MIIERIEQFHIQMPLVHPFQTSMGRQETVDKLILAVHGDGMTGWGESPVSIGPFYSYETVDTAWLIQEQFLIPALLAGEIEAASQVRRLFDGVRGHPMAQAGLEAAVIDLQAKQAGISVRDLLGGERDCVPVGVSIGVQPSLGELLDRVGAFVDHGYQRVKMKIKPGWDFDVVEAVRREYPEISLMVDANAAYSLDDAPLLRDLDAYNLLMIEQPFHYNDIMDHAMLMDQMETPLCLDESINTPRRAAEALTLSACDIINIKPGRVGGWYNAVEIHDMAAERAVPVWCGGMLESGVGRAHNLALASLPNFKLPGDISETQRYWAEDIVEEAFTLNPDGTMDVPQGAGIGVTVRPERITQMQVRTATYSS